MLSRGSLFCLLPPSLGLEGGGLVPRVTKRSLALGSGGRCVENSVLEELSPFQNR